MLTYFNGTRVESSGGDLNGDDSPGSSGAINIHHQDDGRTTHPTQDIMGPPQRQGQVFPAQVLPSPGLMGPPPPGLMGPPPPPLRRVAQQFHPSNVLSGSSQSSMGPPKPPRLARTDSHAAQRIRTPNVLAGRSQRLQTATLSLHGKKKVSEVVKQTHQQPIAEGDVTQFWHLIIDIMMKDDMHGIVQEVDNNVYDFQVGNTELLSVMWSAACESFKTFSDVNAVLVQLQDQDILERRNKDDRHYSFNTENEYVENYMSCAIPSTWLDTSTMQQISRLQVPLISNEYRMSKSEESIALWKLMIYLVQQPLFEPIVHAERMDSDVWIFRINDAGRLAIAWSRLLKSRRTPAYLAGIVCRAKSTTCGGATISVILNLSDKRIIELTRTHVDEFDYSLKFLQQLSLLCHGTWQEF